MKVYIVNVILDGLKYFYAYWYITVNYLIMIYMCFTEVLIWQVLHFAGKLLFSQYESASLVQYVQSLVGLEVFDLCIYKIKF